MVARILTLAIALLGAAITLPTTASAQCRLCSEPAISPIQEAATPVTLQIETSLDFDRLVLGGNGSGTAVIAPDGSRQTSGAVLTIGGRAMVGTVSVRGEAGRTVRVSLPTSITLNGPSGGEVRVEQIRSDLPALPRIGENGTLSFRFGGELHVSGTADGDFRGNFQVDVDYL